MIVIAAIERDLKVGDFTFPGDDVLKALDLNLPFQEEVMTAVYRMTRTQRTDLFNLFNTDRDIALNLISFIDIMLSLFQETDSTIDGSMFAFYQQREWRLVHHMRDGMVWYSLGAQPSFRDPFAPHRQVQILELRNELARIMGKPVERTYLDHCWLLEAIDEIPIADFISSVIVPRRLQQFAARLLREVGSSAELIVSEDLGYR